MVGYSKTWLHFSWWKKRFQNSYFVNRVTCSIVPNTYRIKTVHCGMDQSWIILSSKQSGKDVYIRISMDAMCLKSRKTHLVTKLCEFGAKWSIKGWKINKKCRKLRQEWIQVSKPDKRHLSRSKELKEGKKRVCRKRKIKKITQK